MTETERIQAEYDRRDREIAHDLYAPWQPGEILMVSERERVAASMLKRLDKFPKAGDRCLELGYGRLGWLGRLVSWGMRETDLHGIELDPARAEIARAALPGADLQVGDARLLPWKENYFHFVIVSTLFSSILDTEFRDRVANEIDRVLVSGGVVLWYDAAVNNPRNAHLSGIPRVGIESLFPEYHCHLKSVTLAPPIARRAANLSWTVATMLSGVPFLRTHFLGILIKPNFN